MSKPLIRVISEAVAWGITGSGAAGALRASESKALGAGRDMGVVGAASGAMVGSFLFPP